MKIQNFISSFCVLSVLSLGFGGESKAFSLTSANTLYSFGNQTFGNNAGECKNNVITCNGNFAGASFTGVTFSNFSVSTALGTLGTDYGFERGYSPSAEPDSLGLRANLFPGSGSTVRDVTKYFSFTATIQPLYSLAVSAFRFSVSASGSLADFTSIQNSVETSLSSGVATNGTYQLPTTYSFTESTYNNSAGATPLAVEFRIYSYSVNTGGYGIDSLSFDGNITQVPFDFSPNLGIAILGGLYATKKIIKRAKTKQEDTSSKDS